MARTRGLVLDVLAQPHDEVVDGARVGVLVQAPDLFEQGLARDDLARAADEVISFGGNTFDPASLELRVGTLPYHLTAMEADLLQYLLRNAGKVVSRKAILEDVWDLHEDTDTRAIDNFIVRLRRYLEPDPARPTLIQTVRGVGYRLTLQKS